MQLSFMQLSFLIEAMGCAYRWEKGISGMIFCTNPEPGRQEIIIDDMPPINPNEKLNLPDEFPFLSLKDFADRISYWANNTNLFPSKAKVISDTTKGVWIEER